eukprot:Skav213038  [mRNA]  locus=scaffold844:533987:534439:+ [translate_table: standard]
MGRSITGALKGRHTTCRMVTRLMKRDPRCHSGPKTWSSVAWKASVVGLPCQEPDPVYAYPASRPVRGKPADGQPPVYELRLVDGAYRWFHKIGVGDFSECPSFVVRDVHGNKVYRCCEGAGFYVDHTCLAYADPSQWWGKQSWAHKPQRS